MNKLDAVAGDFVKRMDALFLIDGGARDGNMSVVSRDELRQKKAAGLVDGIHEKLLAVKGTVLPKSKLGEAVDYALGQWVRLAQFLKHPEIELSNNIAENSMRPIAVGRENWIHVGSVVAGPKVAAIFSVVETCKRLGIPVRQYLADVLPGMADRKVAEVAALTPMACKSRRQAQSIPAQPASMGLAARLHSFEHSPLLARARKLTPDDAMRVRKYRL